MQGGGAHGAFTWGVLDRMLEEDWLTIDGISRHVGRGDERGRAGRRLCRRAGAQGARAALERFWRKVPDAARFSPFQRSPLDVLMGRWTLDNSPLFVAMDMMSRVLSPYDLNPGGANPLTDILDRGHRLRRARREPDQAVHHRDQRAHGPRARLPQRRDHTRRAARLRLPADAVPGRRDRRRGLLGRRLFRQSDDDAADPRMRRRSTRSWSRSTRSSAPGRRARRATSSTG